MLENTRKRSSLVHTLTVIFIIAVLLPTVILSIVTFGAQRSNFQNSLYSSYKIMLAEYIAQINAQLEGYTTTMDEISTNKEIVELALNPKLDEMFDLSSKWLQSMTSNGEILRCTLYSSFADADFPYSIEAISDTVWYQQMIEKKNYQNWFYCGEKSADKICLSLVRPIVDTNNWVRKSDMLGVVKLDIFPDVLCNRYYPVDWSDKVDMLLFTREKNLIFTRGEEAAALTETIRSDNGDKWQTGKTFGEKKESLPKNVAVVELKDKNLYVVSRIHTSQLGSLFTGILLMLVYVGLLLVVLFFVRTVLMKILSVRISILTTKMQKLEALDFSIEDHVGGNDEITVIDETFDRMATQMKTLIEQNYEQQINFKNAQLSSMHFQIKPHFLYNALESISSIAAAEGSPKASSMSQKLGKLFRYSTYMTQGDVVPLREELQYVISYIDIQNIRFENKFILETQIEDELMEVPVLKFCIQPFIENIIRYAFDEDDTDCIIRISAQRNGNDINLIVTDYGMGMDEDTVAQIQTWLDCSSMHLSEHIGILNVHARVQLAYGPEYGVTVESTPDVGTVITIKFHI